MDVTQHLRLPRVSACCCGLCSLELGAKIVAIVHMVLIGGLFLFAFVMICIDQYKWYKNGRESYYNDFTHSFIRDEFTMAMVYSSVFFSVVLLFGIIKKDPTYFEPWLIMKFLTYSLNILNMLFLIYERFAWHRSIEIFFLLAYMSLDGYMITIVHSLYEELKGKKSEND